VAIDALHPDGWQQVYAEAGIADPGGYPPGDTSGDGLPEDSGFTDYRVYVNLWYYSQVYEVGIPQGACIGIPFHSIGAYIGAFSTGNVYDESAVNRPTVDAPSFLVKYANTHIRVASGGRQGAMIDEAGFHRVVRSTLRGTEQFISPDRGVTYTSRAVSKTLSDPTVWKDPANRIYVSGRLGQTGWVAARSENDGMTWEEELQTMWDNSYTDCRAVGLRDGGILTIARKGGYLWCRRSADGFAVTYRVCQAAKAHELSVDPAAGHVLSTDGATERWVSLDAGRSWTRQSGVAIA